MPITIPNSARVDKYYRLRDGELEPVDPIGGYTSETIEALKDRISTLENLLDKKIDSRFEAFAYALNTRSGLLSPSLSRQLWALFGRLVLLWIILGSVWLAIVLVALGLSGG